ncbi:MAG TPA: flavin reductase family protein [Pseudonocardiaceae bacterium]|nr:flavin reductase family protein [Pseudonocardiaceae bacterium]
MSVPTECFKDTLAIVATAVSVVGTVDGNGIPWTVTIGSLCALSLDPPLVLFCLARATGSHAVFCSAKRFAVTVLTEDQADVARQCAGPAMARSSVPLAFVDGLPVVSAAAAHLFCSTHQRIPGGDHTIIIGEVQRTAVHHGSPLIYHQRTFRGLRTAATVSRDAQRLGTQHGVQPV